MRIAVIPGDGIGPEVIREALGVLEVLDRKAGLGVELTTFDWGAERYLKDGVSLPEGALDHLRTFDAILFGALGDPRVKDNRHAKDILLGIRFGLDLYINLRPIRCLHEKLNPLRHKTKEDIDFTVLRENTEGAYVGAGGCFKRGTADEVAIQEDVNTFKGVDRIIGAAYAYAREHGLGKVAMADKSNVLNFAHDLWQRVFATHSAANPGIESRHYYVDALTMEMIRAPETLKVIVTCNMFGDIITDQGAALQGGLGMAASGNLHPTGTSLFEPVHGSAPPLAGKEVANPMGAILTTGMMLAHLGYSSIAGKIEQAVVATLESGVATQDAGGSAKTHEVGRKICQHLSEHL